jgi:hypothetical protein
MVFIYILELEDKKYYIGKTTDPNFRLQQHYKSFGAEWTKKYKPKQLIKLLPNCDNFDEDKYTLKYMEKYGIDNVRGGSFVTLTLSKYEKKFLTKMIRSSENKCFYCDDKTHYINDCNFKNIKKILNTFAPSRCQITNTSTIYGDLNISNQKFYEK